MQASIHLIAGVGLAGLWITAAGASAEIEYPSGSQNFETMNVGDPVQTLGWEVVNDPAGTLTVVAADDVMGSSGPRGTSTRWLRATDTDSTNSNRFYSPTVLATDPVDEYEWNFYVNLETTPPVSPTVRPKFTIQHINNGSFSNAWGIEFTSTQANLLVISPAGGTAASTMLYSLAGPDTGVGDWVKLTIRVNFSTNTVKASYNGGAAVSLPINPPGTVDKQVFRLCYRGEGSGNVMTLLVDDPSVAVIPPIPAVSTWGLVALTLLVLSAGTVVLLQSRRTASP